MADAKSDMDAVYDSLRSDLIDLLLEYRRQGRFTRSAEGTDQERSLFLAELTRSIADILVATGKVTMSSNSSSRPWAK